MTLFGLNTVCSERSFVLPVPTESIGGRCDSACGFLGLGRDEGDLPARLGEIVESGGQAEYSVGLRHYDGRKIDLGDVVIFGHRALATDGF